jgi:hypothetical protein
VSEPGDTQPADWHEFFNAAVWASAALLGLLFVAISINLKLILKHRHLPGRAAATLGTLLSVLVACSFGLAPVQSNRSLGVEILATGAVVATQAIWVSVGKRSQGDPLRWTLGNFRFSYSLHLRSWEGAAACLPAQGVVVLDPCRTLLTFAAATLNAPVLLVEILR